MFKNEAAILQAAATLAAAEHTVANAAPGTTGIHRKESVDRLLQILVSMVNKGLIPADLIPDEVAERVRDRVMRSAAAISAKTDL